MDEEQLQQLTQLTVQDLVTVTDQCSHLSYIALAPDGFAMPTQVVFDELAKSIGKLVSEDCNEILYVVMNYPIADRDAVEDSFTGIYASMDEAVFCLMADTDTTLASSHFNSIPIH